MSLQYFETHRCAEHHADLTVVSTSVRRPRVRIGVRMPGHAERIQLADHRHGRAGLPSANIALHAGQSDTGFVRNIEFVKFFTDIARGVHFHESGFRIVEDRLGNIDQPFTAGIDGGSGLSLEFINRWHRFTPCKWLLHAYCA